VPDFVTSDSVRLHYLDEGDGPVVVLVGGFTARARSWSLVAADLVSAGYRVLSVDRRSHGDSDFPTHGQRLSRHAADLHELQSALGLEDAVWVGSSMGASTLLSGVDLFGSQHLRGLVLVDQTPKMVNDATWTLGMHGLTWDALDDFVSTFPGTVSAFHAPPPAHVLAVLAQDAASPYPYDQTRALLRDHASQDWRDVVPRITCPLLAIAGRHSPLWPVASSEWIATHAPRGELAVLDDSGHAPHLSEPELFSKTLLTWIDDL
jgi:pimeloyl-ACP methyl ester carboxylesterase